MISVDNHNPLCSRGRNILANFCQFRRDQGIILSYDAFMIGFPDAHGSVSKTESKSFVKQVIDMFIKNQFTNQGFLLMI